MQCMKLIPSINIIDCCDCGLPKQWLRFRTMYVGFLSFFPLCSIPCVVPKHGGLPAPNNPFNLETAKLIFLGIPVLIAPRYQPLLLAAFSTCFNRCSYSLCIAIKFAWNPCFIGTNTVVLKYPKFSVLVLNIYSLLCMHSDPVHFSESLL
jgi:hypothetical protein